MDGGGKDPPQWYNEIKEPRAYRDKYENYEITDCTFQFYAKFHHMKTMNDSLNQIYSKRIQRFTWLNM